MIRSNIRIPSVAAAALALGSGACDGSKAGDNAEGTRGVDTSSARIRSVSQSMCEAEQRCGPDNFSEEYASVADCTEERVDTFPLAGRTGEDVRKCQDAVLDLGVCFTESSCKTFDDDCADFYESYLDLCKPFEVDDEEDEDDSLNRRLMRGYRIPR